MPTGNYSGSFSAGGVSMSFNTAYTAESASGVEVVIPVAKALSSWVKTDANTAAGNLTGGHGLTTGTFDVYWDGGARYGVPVTITVNACALDGGAGTDFPASANTTVRICKQVEIDINILVTLVAAAFMAKATFGVTDERMYIALNTAADAEVYAFELSSNQMRLETDDTNIDTEVAYALVTNSDVDETVTCQIALLQDPTP